ncbi:hypothetical protein LOK49_LG11G01483 [Camellia lanceoleosa]|uniref:Uncharacterized protein n=1 Tax=Camellia lanceoleosa TaxID=1840588 RepID=A0ACC0G6J3_9ERIC|nr:hypothetical protein LOK49_LG11G01483 [Camellia lanceoleosa]
MIGDKSDTFKALLLMVEEECKLSGYRSQLDNYNTQLAAAGATDLNEIANMKAEITQLLSIQTEKCAILASDLQPKAIQFALRCNIGIKCITSEEIKAVDILHQMTGSDKSILICGNELEACALMHLCTKEDFQGRSSWKGILRLSSAENLFRQLHGEKR